MHISFVTPEYALKPPFGGIATYTRDAARWLVDHGHTVHVVMVSRKELPSTIDDGGVQVHTVLPRRIKPRRLLRYFALVPGLDSLREAYAGWDLLENSLGAWRALSSLSRGCKMDLVEVADFHGLGFWLAASPMRRTPLLVRSHGYANKAIPGWDWPGIDFQLALERFTVRRADFVLTMSVERVANYCAMFDVAPSQIGPWPIMVDMQKYRARNSDQSGAAGHPKVLYLGRVERRKGCDLLIKALHQVHQAAPDMRVTFVGAVADDMKSEFDAFLCEAGGWVTHVGPVPQDDVVSYLNQSDMIVLPSRFETLPRVLVEALATGVPQIAARANGIPEIVEDGVTGLLVDPLTPEALADAIRRLCVSPELRMEMAQKSRARACRKFDINRVMPVQLEVYRALHEGRPPLAILNGQE